MRAYVIKFKGKTLIKNEKGEIISSGFDVIKQTQHALSLGYWFAY